MTQRLIKKQIKTIILFKAKVDRLTTLNDNDFSQLLKSFKNFSNESIITNFVIQEKLFAIKIIEIQFNKYENESYDKYVKYVKQMKFQFNQNDVEQHINESNRKKIDYVMIFLKNIVESNWNAKKLFNSRRVYTWDKFKKKLKIVLTKQKRSRQIFTTNDLNIFNTIIKTLKVTTRNVFITFSFYLKLSNLSSNKSSKNSKKVWKNNIKKFQILF